jgi:hypothetical protein
MNFYLLPPDMIDQWWPNVQPKVEKVLAYPLGPDLYDWWDVYSDCKNKKAHCLVSEDWSYVTIMSVVNYPKAKILDVYLCAGEDNGGSPWGEIDQALHAVCQAFGCTHITVTGRRGWERALKPLGYSFGNVMMTKEVKNVDLQNDGDAPPRPQP